MRPAEAASEETRATVQQARLFRPFRFIPSRRLRRDGSVLEAIGIGGAASPTVAPRFTWRLWRRAGPATGRPDDRGVASTEFALLVPMLLLIVLGVTDLVNQLRAQMRLDATALQLGQLISQCNRIATPGDTDQFWLYAQRIVGALGAVTGAGAQGAVVISAVGQVSGANRVAWQHRTGSTTHVSRVGAAGGAGALPGGFTVPSGQTLFVTEVFLSRDAWSLGSSMMGGATPQVLKGATHFLTRAPDAPSLQQPPTARTQPDCTG